MMDSLLSGEEGSIMDIRGQKGPHTPKPLGDMQASDQIQTQSQLLPS